MNIYCNKRRKKKEKVSKMPAPWKWFDLGY